MQSPRLIRKLGQRKQGNGNHSNFLRVLATENLSLKLFALGLAVLMWAFVASQRRGDASEIKFTTPLVLKNIPAEMEVVSSPIQSVSVLVSMKRGLANSINPSQFQVGIDLSNQLAGGFEYNLSEKNISYNNEPPPDGLTVLQVSPGVIPLILEETSQKDLAIKPRLAGDLATGFTIDSILINPRMVKVRGAKSTLAELESVYTRPLDVQDLDSNVEMQADLDLPSTIRVSSDKETFFRAVITVSNNPTRLLLREIPVIFENAKSVYKTSTQTLNVYLEGPKDIIANLSRDNVYAVLDLRTYTPGDYRGLSPKVIVPDTVKVLEQWPILDLYVIKRKADNSG